MHLGIDIGTSAVKAVLLDGAAQPCAESLCALRVSRPQARWSEQDPEHWWAATCQAVLALPQELRQAVQGIGLSGQMHGATLLDRDDTVLRPAILWNDGRSDVQCRSLVQREPAFVSLTSNLVMPGFTAPKLAWVRDNEPDIFRRVARVLLPKDYIRFRLSGDMASDLSDASGTSWLDVANRTWSSRALAACDLGVEHMPSLYEGPSVTGQLRPAVADQLGLPVVPVVAGGGDNAAGAIGAGIMNEGDAFLSLGTSGVIFVANDALRASPEQAVHAYCHALPERWHQMSVILSAASCLDWACKLAGEADPAALIGAAEQRPIDSPTPVFLPYLSGERTPHNNPDARGVLFGLGHDDDAAALAQAVLEGVAFAFADGLDALRAAGTRVSHMTVIGGGSQSDYWGRILSTVLDCTLSYAHGAHIGPAVGAARLARIGTAGGGAIDPGPLPKTVSTIDPDPSIQPVLAERRGRFRSLYTVLKSQFGG